MGPRSHRRWTLALALGCAALSSVPAGAHAHPPQANDDAIEWVAPEGCPSSAEASARLRARLSPDVAAPHVHAVVHFDGASYAADIEIRAGDVGTRRELASPSCETLLDVTTLLAATVAEDTASLPTDDAPATVPQLDTAPPLAPVVADPPAPESYAPSRAEPAPPATREVDRASPPAIELHVEARFGAGLGLAPDIDLAPGGALGISLRNVAIELAGTGGLARTESIFEGARVRVAWWSIEARACGRLRLGAARRVHVLPCGALHAGDWVSEGRGDALRNAARKHDAWLAAGLGPMLTVALGRRVGLVAGIEGLAFLRRPAAAIDPLGDVLRVRPFGVRALIGVRVRFSVTDRAWREDLGA